MSQWVTCLHWHTLFDSVQRTCLKISAISEEMVLPSQGAKQLYLNVSCTNLSWPSCRYSGAKLYNDLPNSLKLYGQLLPFSRLFISCMHSNWHWFPIISYYFTFHFFLLWSPQWLERVMLRLFLSASPHLTWMIGVCSGELVLSLTCLAT